MKIHRDGPLIVRGPCSFPGYFGPIASQNYTMGSPNEWISIMTDCSVFEVEHADRSGQKRRALSGTQLAKIATFQRIDLCNVFMLFANARRRSSIQRREERESLFEAKLISENDDSLTAETSWDWYRPASLGDERRTGRHGILIDRTE
jgi:hypothetical protein